MPSRNSQNSPLRVTLDHTRMTSADLWRMNPYLDAQEEWRVPVYTESIPVKSMEVIRLEQKVAVLESLLSHYERNYV